MDPIKQIIPDGYCRECTGCCRFAQERSAWAVHLSLGEQQELGVQDTVLPSAGDPVHGGCVCAYFKPAANECSIYYKRPFECRLYPFVINREGQTVFLALDLNCPYAKDRYQTQAMRDYIAYISAVCTSTGFVRMLTENPWLIGQYPGVLNIAAITL